jgi:hypothetical protein
VVSIIALIVQGLFFLLGVKDRFVPNSTSIVVLFVTAILFLIMQSNAVNLFSVQ